MSDGFPRGPQVGVLWFSYRGQSMRGTFVAGERLLAEAVPFDSLRLGDVVARIARDRTVAHRIVRRVPSGGFITQGDANFKPDAVPLTEASFIGKITRRERLGRSFAVPGGWRGRRCAAGARLMQRLHAGVRRSVAIPYGALRASGLALRLWHPRIVVATYAHGEGQTTKFIHRGRTVARWNAEERQWTCRRPFDLVLFAPEP